MYQRCLILFSVLLATSYSLSAEEGAGKNTLQACEEMILAERKPLAQDLENCIYLLESSDEYVRSRPWIIDMGRARLELARSDFEEAVRSFEEINPIIDKLSNKERFRYYILYSTALDYTGEIDKAIKIVRKGIKETIQARDSLMLLDMYVHMGSCYSLAPQLDSGVHYYRKALDIANLINDTRAKAIIYLNYGTLYLNMTLNEKARDCYNRSLDLAVDCDDRTIQVTVLSNLAALLYAEKKYDSSIASLLKLQQLLKVPETNSIWDIDSYAYTLFILGNNYTMTGQYEKAEDHLLEGCIYFKDMNDQIGLFGIYQSLSTFYLIRKDYDISIWYGDSALAISEKANLYIGLSGIYENMAEAYEAKGEYKKANAYHKRKSEFDKEAFDLGKVVSIEDAMLESGLMDKTRELDAVQDKVQFLSKHKKVLTAGLVLLMLITFIIIYAYRKSTRKNRSLTKNDKRREQYIKKQKEKLEIQQQQLKELQTDQKLPLVLPNGKCLQPEDIVYIKSEDHYLFLKMKDDSKHIIRSSLVSFGKKLPASSFLRVHYSYIINLSEIASVRTKDVIMTNREIVKIGPTYLNRFKQAIAL